MDAALRELDTHTESNTPSPTTSTPNVTPSASAEAQQGTASHLPTSNVNVTGQDPVMRQRHAETERLKGNEAMRAGDHAEASIYYTRSLAYAPSAAAFNNRCLAHLKLARYREADADANSVLGLESDNIKVRH